MVQNFDADGATTTVPIGPHQAALRESAMTISYPPPSATVTSTEEERTMNQETSQSVGLMMTGGSAHPPTCQVSLPLSAIGDHTMPSHSDESEARTDESSEESDAENETLDSYRQRLAEATQSQTK